MPFLFLVFGVLFVVSAARNTSSDLLALLKSDFTGKHNFLYWFLAIMIIGALGYVEPLKPVSRAFLVLVVVVLFLTNGGVFQQFTKAIGATQNVQPVVTPNSPNAPTTGDRLSQILKPF